MLVTIDTYKNIEKDSCTCNILQQIARSMVKRINEPCKETYVIGIVREWKTFS